MPRDKLPLLLVMLQDREPRIVFSFVYCLFYFNFYFVFSLPPPILFFFLTQVSKAMVQRVASLSRSSLLV